MTQTASLSALAAHHLPELIQRLIKEIAVLVCFVVASYLLLSLASYSLDDPGWSYTVPREMVQNLGGRSGAWLADLLLYLFGLAAYLLPVMLVITGLFLHRQGSIGTFDLQQLALRWLGFFVGLASGSAIIFLRFGAIKLGLPTGSGGVLGELLGTQLAILLRIQGALLAMLGLFLVGVTLFSGLSWFGLMDRIGATVLWAGRGFKSAWFKERQRFADLRPIPGTAVPKIPEAAPVLETVHTTVNRVETPPAANPTLSQKENDPPHPAHPDSGLSGHDRREPSMDLGQRFAGGESDMTLDIDEAEEPRFAFGALEDDELIETRRIPAAEPPVIRPEVPIPPPETRDVHQADYEPQIPRAMPPAAVKQPPRGVSSLAPSGFPAAGRLPPPSLLDPPKHQLLGYSAEILQAMSREVESKLADFGVEVQVVAVHRGPVVTLFDLQLAPGIKASKITGLAKDLARALMTISVRVVEIIPGKSVIGLEVPNQHRQTVYLREILESDAYQRATSPLTIALGQDITGETVVDDLAKMPHALIAGTTGSGKSVAINTMILSLLLKSRPEDVRLIMIDPKMLELSVYEGIPHLLSPVVTDMKDAHEALRWCVVEMDRRYRLLATLGVRHISTYNVKVEDAITEGKPLRDPLYRTLPTGSGGLDQIPTLEKMPYIVVIIDELADLMMVVGKKVEESIARLAQKARAAGIHLLLATQRPSVDVLTGLIKANIPTRIAFQVSSRVDSRTILDNMGAEQLLGHGDMLYLSRSALPRRLHGAFVSDQEVHRVVNDLKEHWGPPQYVDLRVKEDHEPVAAD
ncbi:MAG: DNA translocase FtsK 4TM domain-containing protein [Pseudomonadota bacterium]